MDRKKSPFEEIFKKERDRKKEQEKEEEKGILGVLDKEESGPFVEEEAEESTAEKREESVEIKEEDRYRELVNDLVENHYFEEAINIIGEMKLNFGE